MIGTAVVARPLDDHEDEGRIEWYGVTYDMEARVVDGDPWAPGNFGRYLVHNYWKCAADITVWWDRQISPKTGREVTSLQPLPADVVWIYLGTPRGLSIMYRDETNGEWCHGWCLWSDDPADIALVPDHTD